MRVNLTISVIPAFSIEESPHFDFPDSRAPEGRCFLDFGPDLRNCYFFIILWFEAICRGLPKLFWI